MITDEARVLYKFFNLKKSYYAVWKLVTVVYYAEQRTMKRVLPRSENGKDDPHQMGGDFVLEFNQIESEKCEFRTVFSHPSQTPPDRVKPNRLIEFLQQQKL